MRGQVGQHFHPTDYLEGKKEANGHEGNLSAIVREYVTQNKALGTYNSPSTNRSGLHAQQESNYRYSQAQILRRKFWKKVISSDLKNQDHSNRTTFKRLHQKGDFIFLSLF